ncbi:hypothetical protein RF11_13702 [Thelohanellus kitauei]|uniref:General transcription factor II-I repeat domain-containing protein 2 n=1 Tax=Thelohanellus kitauei TaxID=669202 RepID=A0A0C2ILF9_THEKT|nr:hypothetical protein RF11_13702 [Thelohanellus kitauei]
MAIDESSDISDTAHFAVFIRAINDHFDVIEELLGLEFLHSNTKGSDLIFTDGAEAMMGSRSGCLTSLEQFLGRQILKYHCILRQEVLCVKTLNLKHVMDVVVRCVNKICRSALKRLEFRQFLSDINHEYGELLLRCEVRWFSEGKVLFMERVPHKKEGSLDTRKSFFKPSNEYSKSNVFASYEIALLMAPKKKLFTDTYEIIKLALKIESRMLDDKNCEKKLIRRPYQIIP